MLYGSRLSRKVPEYNYESYVIIVIYSLNSFRFIYDISMLLIKICP